MLADAFEVAMGAGAERLEVFWESGGNLAPDFALPEGVAVRFQHGTALGERLASAFADLLPDPADRAVVIGADCPDLNPAVIREAFTALDEHDLVLGPARDGGYYLIGLRRPAPALFERVSWGTDRVFAQTLERAERGGLRVATLGVLADIDTPEDLVRFVARRSVSPPEPGPRTESALREMGLLPPRG
jgi:rSAM/selenodomain-associated transferase 1